LDVEEQCIELARLLYGQAEKGRVRKTEIENAVLENLQAGYIDLSKVPKREMQVKIESMIA
jgi:hypothetical protein